MFSFYPSSSSKSLQVQEEHHLEENSSFQLHKAIV
jgi:hypothetical protein